MKLTIVLGTRPEIIKMAPVIREAARRRLDFSILHTGQHYSYKLDRVFFEQLELPDPEHNLEVGSGSHAEETARMLTGIEQVFNAEKPDVVLVEGDTNSVLAGALTAVKMGIRVGHVEAGLRSYDRTMPEEINRVITDHIADLLFVPTEAAAKILHAEGLPPGRVFVTGNTIVDAVYQNRELAAARTDVLDRLGLKPRGFFLATVHRQENVDRPDRFTGILTGLRRLSQDHGFPVIYPIHPRSRSMLDKFGLSTEGLTVVEPLDYLEFLHLESRARLVLTDSGGIQEEACILGVPCVTLRDNTERPETVEAGANALAGTIPERILSLARTMMDRPPTWSNLFGDGRAAVRILDLVEERL